MIGFKNRKQRGYGRVKRAGALLLVLLILLGSIPVLADDVPDGQVEGSTAGKYLISVEASKNKVQECYDAAVSVTNNGSDVSCTLQLIFDDSGEKRTFETQVSLPSGSKKVVKFKLPELYVKNEINERTSVYVDLRKNNSLLARKSLAQSDLFFEADERSLPVGLLSDHPNKLKWLDNAGADIYVSGESKEILLRELDTDFDEDDLAALSYLVIDDIDTSVLTREQVESIQNWVSIGGALWIGTGDRPETVSGFDADFLNANIVNSFSADMVSGDIGRSVIDYGSDYQEVFLDGLNMIRQYSYGAILLSDFKLGDMGVYVNEEKADIAKNPDQEFIGSEIYLQSTFSTLADYSGVINSGSIYSSSYNFQDNLGYIENRVDLHFNGMKVLILFYVILVGPVLYLVLKKMKKREKIWLVLPAVSLLFVGLVYLVGMPNRVNGLQMKTISVSAADGTGNTHSYLSGYQPSNKTWSVKFLPEYYSASGYLNDYYSGDEKLKVVKKEDHLQLFHYPSMSFSSANMLALGENKESGSLTYKEAIGKPVLSGTVTNNTGHDLYYVLVVKYGQGILFRDVKNGESISRDDISHVEESDFTADSADVLRGYASDYYYKDKYEEAKYLAALTIAGDDRWNRMDQAVVIGVTEDDTKVLETNANEINLTCLVGMQTE